MLLYLLFIFSISAVQAEKEYIKPIYVKDIHRGLSPRIIGGEAVQPGEIPYQIGLVADAGWFCGGSLIQPNWVLTAAHCGDGTPAVTIYLGSTKVQDGVQIRSSRIIVNPGWDSSVLKNDVSLVQLASPAPIGGNINLVQLINPGNAKNSFTGEAVRASGWGKESNNAGSVARNLNKVQITVIDNDLCESMIGPFVFESTLCCGGDNIHATCNGDSGGPLVLASTGEQVGVTSFATVRGCASDLPFGFARVGFFLDWINSQINS